MSATTITVRTENEFRLGLGEVIVGHGIHPEYGVPALTFTKAKAPAELGADATQELNDLGGMNTLILVFTTADAVNQHLARLETVMREMEKRPRDEGGRQP